MRRERGGGGERRGAARDRCNADLFTINSSRFYPPGRSWSRCRFPYENLSFSRCVSLNPIHYRACSGRGCRAPKRTRVLIYEGFGFTSRAGAFLSRLLRGSLNKQRAQHRRGETKSRRLIVPSHSTRRVIIASFPRFSRGNQRIAKGIQTRRSRDQTVKI